MHESQRARPQGGVGQALLILRPASTPDFDTVRSIVCEADALGAGAVLIAGGPGALEPLTLLASLAPLTTRIGLLAEVDISETHPYTAARRLAALDHVSGGRAGWALADHADRARGQDYVGAVHALWDSWDDDVHRFDKRGGVYIDTDGIAPAHYAGPFYRVAGPLDIPRPPQGRLPRIGDDGTADASTAGWLSVPAGAAEWRKLRLELEPLLADAGAAQGSARTLRRHLGLADVAPRISNRCSQEVHE